ncbi:hypothetical protein CesoFtcFv8_021501 [Champsocephalus esox]|uniref:Uncharacterized protein n=1 Tax=Champsocephalus esox TaxID=159716 RepID=A0AAN8BDJ1_9TELE|nr:hypothetical protein CesoFtcFv8_021501 [Champsocephalus esox]
MENRLSAPQTLDSHGRPGVTATAQSGTSKSLLTEEKLTKPAKGTPHPPPPTPMLPLNCVQRISSPVDRMRFVS